MSEPSREQRAAASRPIDLRELALVTGATAEEAARALERHGSRAAAQAWLMRRRAAGLPAFDDEPPISARPADGFTPATEEHHQ